MKITTIFYLLLFGRLLRSLPFPEETSRVLAGYVFGLHISLLSLASSSSICQMAISSNSMEDVQKALQTSCSEWRFFVDIASYSSLHISSVDAIGGRVARSATLREGKALYSDRIFGVVKEDTKMDKQQKIKEIRSRLDICRSTCY